MKNIYKSFLFEKHLFVSEGDPEQEDSRFETLFSLANLFGIRIVAGAELVRSYMIRFAAQELGENVPRPFYRGFPESVRSLSADQLLFDQLVHYTVTYGFGDFSHRGHSLFEEDFERAAFKENTEKKEFSVIPAEEAYPVLAEMVCNLLSGTRPLSDRQYELVKTFIQDFDPDIPEIASRNTAVKLLMDTRDLRHTDHILLSDVIRLVDELNYALYANRNVRKLNLKNQDRKFIRAVIDTLFEAGKCDIRTCFEKKKEWCGLLHHIHYSPQTREQQSFVSAMRGRENQSVFSDFEKAMAEKKIREAMEVLKNGKGSAAVLRNLNYIISRCGTESDLNYVMEHMETTNVIVLLQLLLEYADYTPDGGPRTFRFTKYNMLKVHTETEAEKKKRRSRITAEQARQLSASIRRNLQAVLKDRLGKVYIDPAMSDYALPIQENTSQGGFGVLSRGSRIAVGAGKKLRAFTYWEKVNDIDLSVFGIDHQGNQTEFSWRTMAGKQSDAITYSGDQTAGYNGGSEYFDIDIEAFRERYPAIRYLIFCNNVFSRIPFRHCFCKAGCMMRDREDSGSVFEPKTVETSFLIDCDSTFAYLFGFDLISRELLWLNMARDSNAAVAGTTGMRFLTRYFDVTKVINVSSLFAMMAAEVVDEISEADIVVTNKNVDPERLAEGAEIIREYDFEKMIALMNL